LKAVIFVITAKIIHDGEKRVLEIPANFHLPGTEVAIRQSGNTLILEPVVDNWRWLDKIRREISQESWDEIESATNEEVPMQERPELDALFK
jgi:antitoxin VapB